MLKELLYSSFTSIRKFPKNYEETDSTLFDREFRKSISASYLFQLSDCFVTHDGVVIDRLKVIPESLYDEAAKKNFGLKYLLKIFLTKKKVPLDHQKYFLPFNSWYGYGHWIPEVFPRLFSVRDKLHELILLLPDNSHPVMTKSFMLKSLAPFKFKNVVYISGNSYVKIHHLYMASMLAKTGNYNDAIMPELRAFLTDFYKNNITFEKQNIYLSRQKAEKRKIVNEEEILPILKKYNFKIVYAEMMSYEEQVALFLNCKCLVSLHGAGLVNMVFMASRTKVLEIRNSTNTKDLCFFSLASSLNIDYYYEKAIPVGIAANNNDSVTANSISLEKTLIKMLNE